jgi:hypothetical protein
MKKVNLLLGFMAVAMLIGYTSKTHAQNGPVLYFCESYGDNGETGISDRFHHGYLTVMVKSDYELGLSDVSVQFDKYSCSTGKFDYYKKFNFTVKPSMKYIYFSKNDVSDMSFDQTGLYRVFLLDSGGSTVASALIEIIP